MARPVVAIIGRPNVGKSTLVNRLCRSREAIVHDQPGVTRDRTYQDGYWGDREFKVVDTGGLVFDDDSEFLPEIREQAALALEEASVALVIVDGQQGLTAADESIAEFLRSHRCPTLLAVNKCESPEQGLAMAAEFWSLGLGEPYPISAIHGAGTVKAGPHQFQRAAAHLDPHRIGLLPLLLGHHQLPDRFLAGTAEERDDPDILRLGMHRLAQAHARIGAQDELMFGGERSLVIINLSEYQEAHAISRLNGSKRRCCAMSRG